MAFLYQDQNQGIRNDARRGQAAVATVLFHPDFNRRLRNRTESSGPSCGEEGARGLGLRHLYRRWGVPPRPENIYPPGMSGFWNYGQWRPCQQGLAHGESACRHAARARLEAAKWAIEADKPDSPHANSAHRTRTPRIRFRFVLLLTIMTREELWTSGALLVDGLRVRLRGFRKSHHLIPAGPA